MKQIRTIILLLALVMLPLATMANEGGKEEKLDIPETVLEHLSDAYEWHIASYEGRSLSIPLPIIVRSGATGEWFVGTEHSLPAPYNRFRREKTSPSSSSIAPHSRNHSLNQNFLDMRKAPLPMLASAA